MKRGAHGQSPLHEQRDDCRQCGFAPVRLTREAFERLSADEAERLISPSFRCFSEQGLGCKEALPRGAPGLDPPAGSEAVRWQRRIEDAPSAARQTRGKLRHDEDQVGLAGMRSCATRSGWCSTRPRTSRLIGEAANGPGCRLVARVQPVRRRSQRRCQPRTDGGAPRTAGGGASGRAVRDAVAVDDRHVIESSFRRGAHGYIRKTVNPSTCPPRSARSWTTPSSIGPSRRTRVAP